jgi:hypothetical protein
LHAYDETPAITGLQHCHRQYLTALQPPLDAAEERYNRESAGVQDA